MIYTHTIGRIGAKDCRVITGTHGTFMAVDIAVDDKYHSIRRGNVSCSSNLKLMSGCKITRVGHEQKL